jgi:hypothetical protein
MRLRGRIEVSPDKPAHLLSRRDVGYCLEPARFEVGAIGEVCSPLLRGDPVVLRGGWQMGTSWVARRVMDWWTAAAMPTAVASDLRRSLEPALLGDAVGLFRALVPAGTLPGLVLIDHVERVRRYAGSAAVDDALFELIETRLPAREGWRVLVVDRPLFTGTSATMSFRLPASQVTLLPLAPAALARVVNQPASEGAELVAWTGGSPGWARELVQWKQPGGSWAAAADGLLGSRSSLVQRFSRMFVGDLRHAADQLVTSGAAGLSPEAGRALAWLGVVADPPCFLEAGLARRVVEHVVAGPSAAR